MFVRLDLKSKIKTKLMVPYHFQKDKIKYKQMGLRLNNLNVN